MLYTAELHKHRNRGSKCSPNKIIGDQVTHPASPIFSVLFQTFWATSVVAVAVGRLAYGSTDSSLQWYGWLASTGLARWHRRTGQTDREVSVIAQHYSWAKPLDRR